MTCRRMRAIGTPSPPLVNSRYPSGLMSPQTVEMMLAGVARTPPMWTGVLSSNMAVGSPSWGVVRHNVVELCIRDGRHGCHDDGREWGKVPLYLAQPSVILISGDAEA